MEGRNGRIGVKEGRKAGGQKMEAKGEGKEVKGKTGGR